MGLVALHCIKKITRFAENISASNSGWQKEKYFIEVCCGGLLGAVEGCVGLLGLCGAVGAVGDRGRGYIVGHGVCEAIWGQGGVSRGSWQAPLPLCVYRNLTVKSDSDSACKPTFYCNDEEFTLINLLQGQCQAGWYF